MGVERFKRLMHEMERELMRSHAVLGTSAAMLEEARLAITAAHRARERAEATSCRLAPIALTTPRPTTPTQAPEQR